MKLIDHNNADYSTVCSYKTEVLPNINVFGEYTCPENLKIIPTSLHMSSFTVHETIKVLLNSTKEQDYYFYPFLFDYDITPYNIESGEEEAIPICHLTGSDKHSATKEYFSIKAIKHSASYLCTSPKSSWFILMDYETEATYICFDTSKANKDQLLSILRDKIVPFDEYNEHIKWTWDEFRPEMYIRFQEHIAPNIITE